MKNKTNRDEGRFIVWFSNRVYEICKLFTATVEDGLLEGNMPQIAADIHEVRSAVPNLRKAYGKLEGMKECMKHLDEALLMVDRLILKESNVISEDERRECMEQLRSCSGEMAGLWSRGYFAGRNKQQKLKI